LNHVLLRLVNFSSLPSHSMLGFRDGFIKLNPKGTWCTACWCFHFQFEVNWQLCP